MATLNNEENLPMKKWKALDSIAVTISLLILFIFFGGEPDLQDALIEWLSRGCGK